MTYHFDFHNPPSDTSPQTVIVSVRFCADSAVFAYGAARERRDYASAWRLWPDARRELHAAAGWVEEIRSNHAIRS
jgi:hypothetical protein